MIIIIIIITKNTVSMILDSWENPRNTSQKKAPRVTRLPQRLTVRLAWAAQAKLRIGIQIPTLLQALLPEVTKRSGRDQCL